MEAHLGQVLETEFLEDVTVTVRLKDEEVDAFTSQLSNLSAGQVLPVVVEKNPETVFPLS
jgi:putative IMPACT (imprinted ancient) family translation regulator